MCDRAATVRQILRAGAILPYRFATKKLKWPDLLWGGGGRRGRAVLLGKSGRVVPYPHLRLHENFVSEGLAN
jgi:hypothetical protein